MCRLCFRLVFQLNCDPGHRGSILGVDWREGALSSGFPRWEEVNQSEPLPKTTLFKILHKYGLKTSQGLGLCSTFLSSQHRKLWQRQLGAFWLLESGRWQDAAPGKMDCRNSGLHHKETIHPRAADHSKTFYPHNRDLLMWKGPPRSKLQFLGLGSVNKLLDLNFVWTAVLTHFLQARMSECVIRMGCLRNSTEMRSVLGTGCTHGLTVPKTHTLPWVQLSLECWVCSAAGS